MAVTLRVLWRQPIVLVEVEGHHVAKRELLVPVQSDEFSIKLNWRRTSREPKNGGPALSLTLANKSGNRTSQHLHSLVGTLKDSRPDPFVLLGFGRRSV